MKRLRFINRRIWIRLRSSFRICNHISSSLTLILTLISSLPVCSQDTVYARRIIDTLSSQSFHGRGYTNDGAWNASQLIADELSKSKIKPLFGKNYFQEFTYPVTYVMGEPALSIDGVTLKAAEEFIIWPSSPSLAGEYKLFYLKPNNIQDLFTEDIANSFIVIDTVMQKHKELKEFTELITYGNPFGAKGMLIRSEKPMQVHRSDPSRWVHAEILSQAFPDSARKIKIDVLTRQNKTMKVRNTGGIIKGKSDSVIIFTAHYDHIGEFGNYFFPGANDNASGVSMVLDMARHFSQKKKRYTMVFLLLTGEEIGLKGSEYFVSNPPIDLKKVAGVFNLDMVGTGDEGITVVNGAVHKADFARMQQINETKKYISEIKPRAESRGSDHYPFHKEGVKSFFIYTRGGSQAYHNIYDISPALSLSSYSGIMKLLLEYMGD